MRDLPARDQPLWRRVLNVPLVRLALLGPVFFLLIGISNGFRVRFEARPELALASSIAMVLLGLLIYVVFVRLVEQRPVQELSTPGMGRELAAGLAIGAALCVLTVSILMLLGVYRVEGINPLSVTLPALSMALSSAVLEELMWRGGLFRIVEDWLGSWIALAVSALVFGLSHYAPVDGALWGSFSITMEAGVLLAAAYLVTRRLWICMGVHFAWNFAQSGLFSGIVSGAFNQPGLIKPVVEGPALLTGGAFGLEASVVAVLACTLAGAIMLVAARRRGHIRSRGLQRSQPTG